MRGDAGRADLVGALVGVVGGEVAVRVGLDEGARAVALAHLAVAAHLRGRREAVGLEGEAAGVRRARPRLALGVGARALRRRIADDASAGRGAEAAAVLVAGRVDGLGGVRRDAGVARLAGALVRVVEREVGVVVLVDDVAAAVADVLLAIVGGLHRDGRAVRGEIEAADVGDARADLALVVDARAVRRGVAADALAAAVAHLRGSAGRARRLVGEGRRAHRTGVRGAGVVVVGQIRVVVRHDDGASAVTDALLAVLGRLRRDRCVGRGEDLPADAADAGAGAALVVDARAVRRGDALDAEPEAVAQRPRALAAGRVGRDGDVRRDAEDANVVGACRGVGGDVRVVVDRLGGAVAVALLELAVAVRLRGERGALRHVDDAADAGRAGVLLALGVGAAVGRGQAVDAVARAVALEGQVDAAAGVGRRVRVGGLAAVAEVDRAVLPVVRQIGVVVDVHRQTVCTLAHLAVGRRLHGLRAVGLRRKGAEAHLARGVDAHVRGIAIRRRLAGRARGAPCTAAACHAARPATACRASGATTAGGPSGATQIVDLRSIRCGDELASEAPRHEDGRE